MMTMLVDVSTILPCPIADVIVHVRTPRLLEYVAKPIVRFVPLSPDAFPAVWQEGTYWVKLRLLGFIPFGRQAVVITYLPHPNGFSARDNGHSRLIARWDHTITIEPASNGTLYRDRVDIAAGPLTPIIWAFAQIFYRHRQRRWRKLVQQGFAYGPPKPACIGGAQP